MDWSEGAMPQAEAEIDWLEGAMPAQRTTDVRQHRQEYVVSWTQ